METLLEKKCTGQLTFLSQSGDDKIVWDKDDVAQTSDAEKKFDEWKKAGYQMFKIGKKGKQTPITKFDPEAEEILVIQTTKKG
jgi:hypothetical protein